MEWIERSRTRKTIADVPHKANEQHYEVVHLSSSYVPYANFTCISAQVSTEFMLSCLGPYAKYSACLFPTGMETLEEAEVLMLELYCEKAKLKDGQRVLDLGCGNFLQISVFWKLSSYVSFNRMGQSVHIPRSGAALYQLLPTSCECSITSICASRSTQSLRLWACRTRLRKKSTLIP